MYPPAILLKSIKNGVRMRRKQVLGLDISPTSGSAKKLAQDLVSLQSQIYHMTLSINLLDMDSNPGHTNYELNKFGLALAREIKNDLRDHPSKDIVKFYVNLLDECWNQRNYELGARVYQGINDAIKRDEIVLQKGVFELPPEDLAVKDSRKKIEGFLGKIKKWAELSDKHFPTSAASKELYEDHLRAKQLFVPSIEAVMNFIAIRLDNVKSIHIDDKIPNQDKYTRLTEIKKEILDELNFIKKITSDALPKQQVLHFSSLEKKFSKQLSPKFSPVRMSPEEQLNNLLKLNEFPEPQKFQKRQENEKLKSEFTKDTKAEGHSPTLFQKKVEFPSRQKKVGLKEKYRKREDESSQKTIEPESESLLSPKIKK